MRLFSPLLLFILPLCVVAQIHQSPFRTETYEARLLDSLPELLDEKRNIERHVRAFQDTGRVEGEITIPVVFHVYRQGTPLVTRGQIMQQLTALNLHYSEIPIQIFHPADTLEHFIDLAVGMNIRFCLAENDPIRYIDREFSESLLGPEIMADEEGVSRLVSPANYLNVFIADLEEGMAGFAQMPGGPEASDGVVVDHEYFGFVGAGGPFSQGKSLTQLIGNYLGLYDLARRNRCEDDYVADTPVHNAENQGCSTDYKHVSTCGEYQVEMTMNFMDSGDDACQYMFTKGQKNRVFAMLAMGGPRHGLRYGITKCSVEDLTDEIITNEYDQILKTQALSLFPNPAFDEFKVIWNADVESGFDLLVYDNNGRIVESRSGRSAPGENSIRLDASEWLVGTYHIKVKVGDLIHGGTLLKGN